MRIRELHLVVVVQSNLYLCIKGVSKGLDTNSNPELQGWGQKGSIEWRNEFIEDEAEMRLTENMGRSPGGGNHTKERGELDFLVREDR